MSTCRRMSRDVDRRLQHQKKIFLNINKIIKFFFQNLKLHFFYSVDVDGRHRRSILITAFFWVNCRLCFSLRPNVIKAEIIFTWRLKIVFLAAANSPLMLVRSEVRLAISVSFRITEMSRSMIPCKQNKQW